MATEYTSFDAPTCKLKWGRHRIREFAWILKQYEQANPVTQKHIGSEIVVERQLSPPDELALVLGDAIHNLRTALDLLAGDLVRRNRKNATGVYFPFAKSESDLDKQIRNKKFGRAGQAAVSLLRKLAPYRGGNEELRGLHELDIMDKHQLIIPVFQGFQMFECRVKGPNGVMAFNVNGPGDGFSISATSDDILTWDSLQFFFVFSREVPVIFAEKPVVDTLERLATLVEGVVELFRTCPTDETPRESTREDDEAK